MRIYVVDAFTEQAFSGNPAGVCLIPPHRVGDDGWMQSVAAEMRHSETAFLAPSAGPDADWDLRWFTPATEVDLCGHATLAAAHVLFEGGHHGGSRVRFATRSGVLSADLDSLGVALDFPVLAPRTLPMPAGLAATLGREPVAVAAGGDDLLVELATSEQVRGLQPDLDAVAALPFRGLVVTAPSPQAGVDVVSRFFAPSVGVPEDPVTGSAHCLLAPYWAPRFGRSWLTATQGGQRRGTVAMELRGERVRLLGRAVTVLAGELLA